MNRERLPWRLVYRVALVAAAIITLSAVPGVGAHAGDPEGPISGVRVPAEWELQEAIWLQWPGRFEKVYEPAFAEIVNVVTKYQRLHILHGSSATSSHARAAITAAGGDPDHPNITYHQIPNDSAWMRDNGPIYVVKDGEMRIQNWGFDAWGGGFGDVPYADDDAVPIHVGEVLGMPVDPVKIVHERGNLEFNGVDAVILNWNVISEPGRGNGYTSKAEAEADLLEFFGVTRVVWADGPITGDRTAGHIDHRGGRRHLPATCLVRLPTGRATLPRRGVAAAAGQGIDHRGGRRQPPLLAPQRLLRTRCGVRAGS
ncbi:MAG: agmatine deiminase family protein [bacterium]|nr:agmatine deiminase family protein [bacterium]